MNKNMLCSRCHKNPAVFFISKIDGDKTTNEGLCIKCAMELNIGPVKQIMDQMGISEDEMNDVAEQMNQMMENPDGIEGFQPGGALPLSFYKECFRRKAMIPKTVPTARSRQIHQTMGIIQKAKEERYKKQEKKVFKSLLYRSYGTRKRG